jgi:signal transduction histidine kinase
VYDFKNKYDFQRFNIIREYDPFLPKIPCAQNQIQQVILNLLTNAAQAISEQNGQEEEPKIILRTIRDNDMARVEIEDNGPGMLESIRKRVFEPFFTTKAVGVGTGLGLSVSYFIITEHHNGTMSVESEPGKGAKFTICLPLKGKNLDKVS